MVAGLVAQVEADGRPACRERLERMLAASGLPPGSAVETFVEGPVALGLCGTPGASAALLVTRRVATVAVARLDEPLGLRERLLAAGAALPADPSDGFLVAACFERWGPGGVVALRGDLACLAWQRESRRLWAFRDRVGLRQLHYAQTGWRGLVATAIGAVRAGFDAPPPPNGPVLQDLLRRRYARFVSETASEGVLRLPPGCSWTVEEGAARLERQVDFQPRVGAPGKRLEDWQEELGQALERAVVRRLPAVGRAGLLLSGGLDSSSVAYWAARARTSHAAELELRAYSAVCPTLPAADESAYVATVLEALPAWQGSSLPADDCWGLAEFGAEGGFPLDEAELDAGRALVARLLRRAAADGCSTVLTGAFADQLFVSEAYGATSLLREVPRARLAAELPHFVRSSRHPAWLVRAFASAHRWVPERLRRLGRGRADEGVALPPGAESDLALEGSAAMALDNLQSGFTAACLYQFDALARSLGVELRLPYLDHDLIELALGMPPEMRYREGRGKAGLRQLMVGRLPDAVLARRPTPDYDALIHIGLRTKERDKVCQLLKNSCCLQGCLIEQRALEALSLRYFEAPADVGSHRDLVLYLCVEAWLRHHAEGARGL